MKWIDELLKLFPNMRNLNKKEQEGYRRSLHKMAKKTGVKLVEKDQ